MPNSSTQLPMLTCQEQIDHLKKKGVTFSLCSEDEALTFLKRNNNYFKIRAYRKNFPKKYFGPQKGQYSNLDFAMLKDLSAIDRQMRYTFLTLCLDLEHFLKVKLLDNFMGHLDPYAEVATFLATNSHIAHEITRNKNNPYCGNIIKKYPQMPVWVFLEVISFGTFVSFYEHCAKKLKKIELMTDALLLQNIRQLRNACAHNNCLIHNMNEKNSQQNLYKDVNDALISIGISANRRKKHPENIGIRHIVILLYFYSVLFEKHPTCTKAEQDLKKLLIRMKKNYDWYAKNTVIQQKFLFLEDVICGFFPDISL